MALSTTASLALMAAAAGASAYNTQRTAKKQDRELGRGIENQARKQRGVDARVEQEVQSLKGSRSADERDTAQASYMDTLRRNRARTEGGLSGVGGAAFQADSAAAAEGLQDFGARSAELMARIDAPGMQRRGEAFGYGNLATDINLASREASGQAFIDQLRLRAIKRNPWIDAAASAMGGAAGAGGGAGGDIGPVTRQPVKNYKGTVSVPKYRAGG